MPKARTRLSLSILLLVMGPALPSLGSEYGLTFNRDNRTYRWNNFIQYAGPIGQKAQVRASGNLSKTLIKSARGFSGADRWQDSYSLSTGLEYLLTRWATMGINLAHQENSVNRGEITTRTGTFSSSIAFHPRPSIRLEQFVGGKLDQKKQPNTDSREEGLSYGFSGSWQPAILKTKTTLKVGLSGDRLTAGHSSSRTLLASLSRELHRGVKISLSFDDRDDGRTNLFGPAQATVLKRQDRIHRALNFKVELPLPRDHRLHLSLSSADRRIEYSLPEGPDEEVAEQNSRKTTQGLEAQVTGQSIEGLSFSGDFALQRGKNDFGRDINDEDLQEISLSGSLGATLSSRDSLGITGHVARTSYDTPHPDNFNDRDSYRSAAKVAYQHTFSAALRLVVEAMVNVSHLVYLRSQRSANNNWQRLYAIYPAVHIRPLDTVLIQQRFSISANYTEYDFEDLFTDIKSNIFRQAKSTTDLRCRLGDQLDLNFSYSYRVEDFGRLVREDKWVEVLSWDKSFQNVDLSISYPLVPRLIITPNLGYGHRREYDHRQGQRHFKNRLRSKRIGLSGRYRLRPNNDMTFSASRSVEYATEAPKRIFDRLQLSLQHAF
jgi:hypothetical protein